jgi:hypothetical protein
MPEMRYDSQFFNFACRDGWGVCTGNGERYPALRKQLMTLLPELPCPGLFVAHSVALVAPASAASGELLADLGEHRCATSPAPQLPCVVWATPRAGSQKSPVKHVVHARPTRSPAQQPLVCELRYGGRYTASA